ncbi:MAG TPA: hypothetical protein VIV40_42795 [Kofleriaceae bacterium]
MRFVAALVTAVCFAGCVGSLTDAGGGPGATTDGGAHGPDAKQVDVKGILRTFSGCMTLTNFQAAKMTTAWSTLTTNDGKQCMNCHDAGEYNFIASDDETQYFSGLSQHSYFMLMYFSVDPATEKVIVNTQSFKGANSTVGHPKFNADANQGMTALQTFYTASSGNTACGAPTMID